MKNYDFIMTMSLVVISKLRQLVIGCITQPAPKLAVCD